MKVLHCIPTLEGGGGERQLAYLAAGLKQRDIEAHVAFTRRGPNFARLQASGATLHEIPLNYNHSPALLWSLWRLVRLLKPDLIQTWLTQMDIAGGMIAKLTGTPWILSERNSALSYPASLKNSCRCRIATGADAIVANSRAGKDYWDACLKGGGQRSVVANALPLEEIQETIALRPNDLPLESGEKLILYVGRFHSTKNLRGLLRALRQVADALPVKAVLCGTGPEQCACEELIAQLGLTGKVHLKGYVSNPWEWLKRADVFTSVSFVEGHPNTVMEAMACGTPLVVSDIAAHREFLDSRNAHLVDPNLPEAIASAILDTLKDAAAARNRAALAHRKTQDWSIARMTGRYVEIYEQLLRSRGKTVASKYAPAAQSPNLHVKQQPADHCLL